MAGAQIKLAALVAVTVATLAVIAMVGGQPPGTQSAAVLHSGSPAMPIYQRKSQLAKLPELFAARRRMAVGEPSAEESAVVARLSLEIFQATGNARLLGAAESAIAAWDNVPQPPSTVWLLRGRILQTRHHFAAAAQDLSLFNRVYVGVPEALLLEADAWRRAGAVARSRGVCMQLALHGRMDLATFCAAEVLLSVGQPGAALARVESVIDYAASLPAAERNWALAIYADVLCASGNPGRAATIWAKVLESDSAPLSYQLAYADVLLSLARYQDVVELLGEDAQMTGALLRVIVAATRLGHANAASRQAALKARLDLGSRMAAGELHLREQALYALWLDEDVEKSLALALRNWELQKGWEDAALVLEIADRLHNTGAMRRIRDWQQAQAGSGAAA